MNPEQGLLRNILLWLAHRQGIRLRNERHGLALDLHSQVTQRWQSIDETELEGLIGQKKTFSTNNRFIFLETRTRHGLMLPILSMEYNFARSCPVIKFRVALFGLHNGALGAIGFRFEAPEGQGDHNYYHAQLTEKISDRSPRLPCQEWMPLSYPALTLNAVNAVTLCISMLISLYGLSFAHDLSQRFGSTLISYMRDMHWSHQAAAVASRWRTDNKGRWTLKPV